MSGVYVEEFDITKVGIHLFLPEVYIEKFGITKVVINLLVSGVYIEQFSIAKVSYTYVCQKFISNSAA